MAGRPTKYKPEVIDQINEYIKGAIPQNMKIPTVEGIALELGISRDTLYEWAKVHPEFSDTLEELKLKQKEILTEIGIFGGKEINATIVQLLLKVNHNMIETERKELVGANGGPITVNLINDYLSTRGIDAPSVPGTSGSNTLQDTHLAQEGTQNIDSIGESGTRGTQPAL